jgi:hypothetical protein
MRHRQSAFTATTPAVHRHPAQADAYAGYNRLYLPDRKPGPMKEALCWAHAGRKFFVLSDIAVNAQRGKNAMPIADRLRSRQAH